MQMNRRDYLSAAGLVFGGLVIGTTSVHADVGAPSIRARLSLNENPFGPSPQAIAAIRSLSSELCRYSDADADVLTPAIAAHEDVAADQIVLGEVLPDLGRQLAKDGPSGGEFVYSEPGYMALVDAVRPLGGVAVGVPLDKALQNDLAAIAAKVNAQTRAIYLVNPHNPTGTVSDTATFASFVREVSKRALVIVDEAYLEFEPDFDQRSVVGQTRAGGNVVVFRTFGKIYGLAGLSVGYAITPKPLAAALKKSKVGTPDGLTRPALVAAAASLRDRHYVASTRAKVAAERAKWNDLVDGLGLRRSDARGNFVFFETGRPHHDVKQALSAKGIDVGRAFAPFDDWVRISIGLPAENTLARKAVGDLLKKS